MQPLTGIALKLVSIALFMVMSVLVKAAGSDVPTGEVVFFRSFFAMPVILAWLAWRGELAVGLRTRNPAGHFWRGVIGTTAMGLGFGALVLMPLPEVTAVGFAAPLMTVILAALMLGEVVRLFRWSAVLVGLAGVVIVIWPQLTVLRDGPGMAALLGVGLALGSAAFRALATIHIRRLTRSENTAAIVFYFSLTATLVSLVTAPFGWTMPDARDFAMLAGAGVLGGVAQIFMTSAYARTDASVLAPFEYTSMLFALAFGYLFFAEVATPMTLAGSVLIVGAGIAIILRERHLGLKRGKARPAMTPQG